MRRNYTYRCKHCGFECVKKVIPDSGTPKTKFGNYGSNATPVPTQYVEEMYSATTISFTAATSDVAAKISDSAKKFVDNLLSSGMSIRVATDSGTNDEDYTIAARGVSAGEILLISTDSLTTEAAATAGTVTISRLIYEPDISTGCPFCGSLNSK